MNDSTKVERVIRLALGSVLVPLIPATVFLNYAEYAHTGEQWIADWAPYVGFICMGCGLPFVLCMPVRRWLRVLMAFAYLPIIGFLLICHYRWYPNAFFGWS